MLKRLYLTLFKFILNKISPSFCLAKWLQGTLHLQNGFVHCCHHPIPHKIPLDRLSLEPELLYNTPDLLLSRAQMRRGIRPKECSYCWSLEDSSRDVFSDRIVKSAQPWALRGFLGALFTKKNEHHAPKFLEVSFSSFCNMNCLYCTPENSSSIMEDVQKHGPYPLSYPLFDLESLRKGKSIPLTGVNPYLEAFKEWFPKTQHNLHTLRITGGEPFLQKEVEDFLQQLQAPKLKLAINSNLNFSMSHFQKKIESLNGLVVTKRLSAYELFVSLDTVGLEASYIRQGLDLKLFWENVEFYLGGRPGRLTFLCTFSALTLFNFEFFLEKISELRSLYPKTKIILGPSSLRHPEHLTARLIPKSMDGKLDHVLVRMKSLKFSSLEVNHFVRIVEWIKNSRGEDCEHLRRDLIRHLEEKDRRFGTDYKKTFPEITGWV